MAVTDLWYQRTPGPDGEPIRSARHGRAGDTGSTTWTPAVARGAARFTMSPRLQPST
jgi:hypothetical protein